MHAYVEKEFGLLQPEKLLKKNKMSRAAYRKKFRETLYDSQDYRLKYVHLLSFV
jgi:hypothetical protein